MSTALSIKGKTQANDAVTSTINYVNPAATNAQLQSLASAMNALTTNTIVDVTRIDKNSLTAAVPKLSRNLALAQSSIAWSSISTDVNNPTSINVTGNALDEGKAYLDIKYNLITGDEGFLYANLALASEGETSAIMLVRAPDSAGTETPTDKIEIFMPETNTYQAATVTLTIT